MAKNKLKRAFPNRNMEIRIHFGPTRSTSHPKKREEMICATPKADCSFPNVSALPPSSSVSLTTAEASTSQKLKP